MRPLRRLCLLVILAMVSASQAQGGYPACWETELSTSLVSLPFYESYFSWLDDVETAEDLVEFAESHLPSRERDWGSNEGCAEAVELTWRTQQALSLRAAYKAVEFGLLAKVDADKAVLARNNPVRAILADPYYPTQFMSLVDSHQALIDSGERRYELSPEEDALPACSEAQLSSLAPLMPDYRRIVTEATEVEALDDLLELAQRQFKWRETWARNTVEPQADGSIHYPPKDGLKLLPPCREAAELLWLMNRAAADVVTGAALSLAGLAPELQPYDEAFSRNDERARAMFERIESIRAEPAPIGKWTSCNQHTEEAMRRKLPEYSVIIDAPSRIRSWDDYLAFAEEELAWRRQLWEELPNCAEAIEVALKLSEAASDVSALVAFTFAGADMESNPFIEKLSTGAEVAESLHYATLGASRFREKAQRLPGCSASELETLEIVVAQYHLYREAMAEFANLREFVTISESLYGWRDGLYAALPACMQALEFGALMGHIADDYIALFGLVHAGYGRDSNPYYTSFQANSFELVDWIQAVDIKRGAQEIVWNYGGQIEGCSSDELGALGETLNEYLAALNMGANIHSLESLSAFGDTQIAWRRDSWAQLPNCAEAFEIGLHIYRTAGDRILFGVPAIAEDKLAEIFAGDRPLNSRLREIYAELPVKWRPQHSGKLESHRQHCSSAQTAAIKEALRAYAEMLDAGELTTDPVALRRYVDTRIQWRQDYALNMPRCLIVFKLDELPGYDLAQSVTSEIPVLGAVLRGGDLLQAILSSLSGEDHSVPAITPNSNRMPLCSNSELRRLQENMPAYAHIIDTEDGSQEQPELFGYVKEKLDWRDEIWPSVPYCAEAVELVFLIDQVASDIATINALRSQNVADSENPFLGLPGAGRAALQSSRDKIAALVNSGARRDTPDSSDMPLPRCAQAELDVVHEYTFGRHLFPTFKEETLPALKEYMEHVLSWRAETWTPLPACLEAYIFGALVSRHTGDLISYFALDWSGVSRSENPFFPNIRDDAFDLLALTEALRKNSRSDLDKFVEDYRSRSSSK